MIKLATILNKQTCNGLKMYRNEWMTEIPSGILCGLGSVWACVGSVLCIPCYCFPEKKKI